MEVIPEKILPDISLSGTVNHDSYVYFKINIIDKKLMIIK